MTNSEFDNDQLQSGYQQILPLGNLLHANDKGFLVSDLKKVSFQTGWKDAVDAAVEVLLKNIPDIHSIYVRGSVATGRAIKSVSDVDFLVTTSGVTKDHYKQSAHVELTVLNEKFPYVKRFDVGYYSSDEIINIKEKVLVKIRSICIYGESLAPSIKELRPGIDVRVTLLGLEKEIEQTLHEIEMGYYTDENTKAMCTWVMKRLVRGGMELVSERELAYTRDLYVCHTSFAKYYEDFWNVSYQVLKLAIFPTLNLILIKELIIKMGFFLVMEAKK